MQVERNYVPEATLEQFAEQYGLTLVINERRISLRTGRDPLPRFYASFRDVEVMQDGCLVGESGNGETEREAIDAYAYAISEKRIAVDAMKPTRREIDVPRLVPA